MVRSELTTVRQKILLSATRRFAAQGFDGTAIQQIADDVDVSKQAVLHHFATKDELRLAVIEHVLSHWASALPRLLVGATEGAERYDVVTKELCAFFAADADRARLLVREVMDRPVEMKELLTEKVQPFIAAVARYVKKGQETGEIYADIDAEAYLVNLMMQVISGVATIDTVGVLLGGSATSRRSRFLEEILRGGKRSLFEEVPATRPRAKAPTAKKKPPVSRRRERTS